MESIRQGRETRTAHFSDSALPAVFRPQPIVAVDGAEDAGPPDPDFTGRDTSFQTSTAKAGSYDPLGRVVDLFV